MVWLKENFFEKFSTNIKKYIVLEIHTFDKSKTLRWRTTKKFDKFQIISIHKIINMVVLNFFLNYICTHLKNNIFLLNILIFLMKFKLLNT